MTEEQITEMRDAHLRAVDSDEIEGLRGITAGDLGLLSLCRDYVPRLLEERKMLLEALREIAKEPPGCDAAWIAKQAIVAVEGVDL